MKYFSRNDKLAARFREKPTPPEQRLKDYLDQGVIGYHFQFQVPILNYIVDFYSPELNLVLEVDGNTHKHTINRRRDRERDYLLWENAGILTFRIAARAIFSDIKSVHKRLDSIIKNIEKLDEKSPLLRYKANTTRVIKRTPAEKKKLIQDLELRGKIKKKWYSPC